MGGYREFAPPPPLVATVECGWRLAPEAAGRPGGHRVLPDGCMDLIWSAGRLLVAGPDTTAFLAAPTPGVAAAGLRFRPGALPGPLGVPAAALRDQRVELAQLLPGPARLATTRIEDGTDPLRAIADLITALPGRPADRWLLAVAGSLAAGAGAADTADALGCTTRTLHRRCLAGFGYGPAVLRRILRFRRAVALLHRGQPAARVAAVCGYADQPHLARELRVLAGVPAATLLGGGVDRPGPPSAVGPGG